MFQSKTNSIFKFEDQLRVELIIIYIYYTYAKNIWPQDEGIGRGKFLSAQNKETRIATEIGFQQTSVRVDYP